MGQRAKRRSSRLEGGKIEVEKIRRWEAMEVGIRNAEKMEGEKVGRWEYRRSEVRGQRPDGWMIRMKNVTSVSKHFTDQAGNLGLRVSLRLLEAER